MKTKKLDSRYLISGAGLGLLAFGISRRTPLGIAAGTVGLGLLGRALWDPPTHWDPKALVLRRRVFLEAPVNAVYDFWRNFENHPQFMSAIREVRVKGDRLARWKAEGPTGIALEWESRLVRDVPHRRLVWQSAPGSLIQHGGEVRFRRSGTGTKVDITLTYLPPKGALPNLAGQNPTRQLTHDLTRMKQFVEADHRLHRQMA